MKMLGFFKKRNRKTVNAKIVKEISGNIGRIATQIARGKRNEEETRRWCVDMVRSAFGYKDDEIETELTVLGQRVDIALLDGRRVIAVIECKAATLTLGMPAINQAANYAMALGAEWAITTNGHQWLMFHVIPKNGAEPDIHMIFDVQVLDDDGLSKEDVNNLYFITKQAILSGETKQAWHENNLLSFENIKEVVTSPEVIALVAEKLKTTYKAKHGVTLDPDKDSIREVFEWVVENAEQS